jgi:hypothetical protein
VLRSMFGPKTDDVTKEWTTKEELYAFLTLYLIID